LGLLLCHGCQGWTSLKSVQVKTTRTLALAPRPGFEPGTYRLTAGPSDLPEILPLNLPALLVLTYRHSVPHRELVEYVSQHLLRELGETQGSEKGMLDS
jgi:hypothetical protein